MKDKGYNNDFGSSMHDGAQGAEYKEGAKYPLSKFDFELYDEAKAIPARVVRVKRMSSAAKGERWRIFDGEELKFVLDGSKLSKKERSFLQTISGVNWLISEFKIGFKSFNELRSRLKSKMVK